MGVAKRVLCQGDDDGVPSSPLPGVHPGMVLPDTSGNTVKFLNSYCRTIMMQYSFPDTARVWNSLPQDVTAENDWSHLRPDFITGS